MYVCYVNKIRKINETKKVTKVNARVKGGNEMKKSKRVLAMMMAAAMAATGLAGCGSEKGLFIMQFFQIQMEKEWEAAALH